MNEIAIDLPREAYIPREKIQGAVKLWIDKTVSARAVKLEILGTEKTHIERRSNDDSHVYREINYILRDRIILHSPQYDDDMQIEPGNYVFEFDFMMPESAPPSYRGSQVDIVYELNARVDVPWWFDIVRRKPLYVFRSREPLDYLQEPVQFQSSNYYDTNPRKPGFMAEISKTGFLTGEVIEGSIALKNMHASNIRKIYVTLLGIEYAEASRYSESTTQFSGRIEIPVDDMYEGAPKLFNISVPRNCPPSYESRYSNFRWGLEIGLDIPLGFDVKALHPIEILH